MWPITTACVALDCPSSRVEPQKAKLEEMLRSVRQEHEEHAAEYRRQVDVQFAELQSLRQRLEVQSSKAVEAAPGVQQLKSAFECNRLATRVHASRPRYIHSPLAERAARGVKTVVQMLPD